jgi:hypothetical protein
MRVMAKITIPVESGGDGTIGKVIQRAAERWKPEAMYFGNFQGQRTAFIVFDMPDSSDMVPFSEPFFQELSADVEITPVMAADDFQKGLAKLVVVDGQSSEAWDATMTRAAEPASPETPPSMDRRPRQRLLLPATAMRIGRTPDNDLPLADDLAVSRHHAELRRSPTGSYEIVDLGSHNGTFVNGKRVSQAMLTEHDIVRISHSTFRLAEGELWHFVDDREAS